MLRAVDVGRDAVAGALRGIRALLLDMDGVLISRGQPIPGAGPAIARLNEVGVPFRVITNTSLASRARLAQRLSRAGIDIAAGQIVTALSATVAHLGAAIPGGAVYLLGSADAHAEFSEAEVRLLSNEEVDAGTPADSVVVGDSEDQLTYDNLNRAFRQVRAGAAFVAMHRNPWWLTAAGPTLDSGALVVGLEYATGRRATVAGKPSATIFRAAFAELADEIAGGPARTVRGRRPPATADRLRRNEAAMVGDDPGTDLAPARRMGMRTVLVLTGKHREADVASARRRRGSFVPDAVAQSIVDVVDTLLGE